MARRGSWALTVLLLLTGLLGMHGLSGNQDEVPQAGPVIATSRTCDGGPHLVSREDPAINLGNYSAGSCLIGGVAV